jgi:hypothetical protein
VRVSGGVGEGIGEGGGILPGGAIALSDISFVRPLLSWVGPTCSLAHSTTMPSRSDALALLALTRRSSMARVIGVGGSILSASPYLVAVISKNCISLRILFKAEMSRSMVRYMGWNCEFCVCGSLILASSCPMKRM